MARKNAVRTVIQLTCTGDHPYTYHSEKNTRNVPKRKEGARGNPSSNRLELRKYCPRCRSHQIFRETRR